VKLFFIFVERERRQMKDYSRKKIFSSVKPFGSLTTESLCEVARGLKIIRNDFIFLQILGVLLVHSISSSAQNEFKKVYPVCSCTTLYPSFNSFLTVDSSKLMIFQGFDGMLMVDTGGNILKENVLGNIYKHRLTGKSAIKTTNNCVITLGEDVSVSPYHLSILKIDTSLNVRWQKNFSFDRSFTWENDQILETSSNQFLISESRIYPALIKTDTSGNIIWAKTYRNRYGGLSFIKETLDGDYLVGINWDSLGLGLMKLDTSGSVVWTKSYPSAQKLYSSYAIEQLDSSMVILGVDRASTDYSILFKVSKDGLFQWGKEFALTDNGDDVEATGNLIQTMDGGFVITATHKNGGWYNDGISLIRTDSSGDIIWARRNSDTWSVDIGLKSLRTQNGGFYTLGTMRDNHSPYYTGGVLLKMNEMGWVGCEDFTDSVLITSLILADSNIIINDSIESMSTYDTPVTYATFSPQTYLDYCIPGTLIDHVIHEDKEILFPNPTTGKLIVELSGPLTSDCYFSVYDHTGRLVFQRTLYTEKEKIEVDLSPYGKGLYLVEFTEKEQVSVKKVVVE
jgi:hypothetical protein